MSVGLEKKLATLAKVEIRKSFRNSLRKDLMRQVSLNKPERAEIFVFRFPQLLKHAYASVVLGIFLFFSCGTVLAMKAAGSMPGDFLYSVKRASEKAQVGLTLSQASKVNKEVGLASKRIEELAVLTTAEAEGNKEKEQAKIKPEKIARAVNDFHKEISNVKTRLSSLDKNGDDKAKEAAMAMDKKTEEFANALNQAVQKEELPEQVKERIVNAINTLNEVSSQALGVMIKAEDASGGEFEVLVARLEEMILKTEQRIGDMDKVVVGKGLIEDRQGMVLSLEKKIELAKIILAEARECLNNKDLGMTLQKLEESKGLANEVDKELGSSDTEDKDVDIADDTDGDEEVVVDDVGVDDADGGEEKEDGVFGEEGEEIGDVIGADESSEDGESGIEDK